MAVDRTGLTSFATSKVGLNYVWGGEDDSGYDCSGLMQTTYASQGVSIPRVAQDQYNKSTKVSVENLQAGDMVFFSDTGSTNNVTHVGMYIGNGQYVHAANSKQGVITSTLNTNGSYFVGAGTYAGSGKYSGTNISDDINNLSGYTTIFDKNGNVTGAVDAAGNYVSNAIPNAVDTVTGAVADIANAVTEAGNWKEKILIFLGHIVKVLTLCGVFAVAAVLFIKAFDIKVGGIAK